MQEMYFLNHSLLANRNIDLAVKWQLKGERFCCRLKTGSSDSNKINRDNYTWKVADLKKQGGFVAKKQGNKSTLALERDMVIGEFSLGKNLHKWKVILCAISIKSSCTYRPDLIDQSNHVSGEGLNKRWLRLFTKITHKLCDNFTHSIRSVA